MLNLFKILLIAIFLILSFPVLSQSDTKINHLSIEIGLGMGIVGNDGGPNSRLSLNYLSKYWGGEIRHTNQAGEKLSSGNFGTIHWVIREQFVENAILLSRIIKQTNNSYFVGSAGVGLVSQRDSKNGFKNEPGFAYSIGMKKIGKFFGYSTYLGGNINGEEVLISVSVSFTLNLSW